MMQWVREIQDTVRSGIYVNNLRLIVDASAQGMIDDSFLIAAFVMRHIAQNVLDMWDGSAVRQREHRIVEDGLRKSFNALLEAINAGVARDEIVSLAEDLIRSWQTIQNELRELAQLTGE